jgi:hypothetical protein
VPLQLQMIPSEMLPLNRNETTTNCNVIRRGIEFDAIGRRVAYHFLRRHPGDVTDPGLAGDIVRIPASEIVHIISSESWTRRRAGPGVERSPPAGLRPPQAKLSRKSNQIRSARIRRFESYMPSQPVRL